MEFNSTMKLCVSFVALLLHSSQAVDFKMSAKPNEITISEGNEAQIVVSFQCGSGCADLYLSCVSLDIDIAEVTRNKTVSLGNIAISGRNLVQSTNKTNSNPFKISDFRDKLLERRSSHILEKDIKIDSDDVPIASSDGTDGTIAFAVRANGQNETLVTGLTTRWYNKHSTSKTIPDQLNVEIPTNKTNFNTNQRQILISIRGENLGRTTLAFYLHGSPDPRVSPSRIVHSGYKVGVVRVPRAVDTIFTVGIAVMVSVLTLGMGCSLDITVVWSTLKKPISPAIGFSCQYLIMPLVSSEQTSIWNFDFRHFFAILQPSRD